MIRPLKDLLARWRDRRQLMLELRPERFQALVQELGELMLMAATASLPEEDHQDRMEALRLELDDLQRLVDDPGFGRLPMDRRRELRTGLDESRQMILRLLRSSSPPTQRLQ